MNCILFLDFDGVTHPDPCRKEAFFCQLPLIEDVLRTHKGVELVISSSWRYEDSLDKLRSYFSADIRELIVGVTPSVTRTNDEGWIPPDLLRHHREWECRKWIRQHRPTDVPWLAIDDVSDWFLPGCADLLVTRSECGFQPEQVSKLHEMLKARLKVRP
ncbi:MAG: hypothetical protein A2535_06565 [Burkholderiales bacterium RIFOXYD2_FULL_59_8]|nr:MAG: hypothetical protein A2535_06565 [Burkholderiales bacterium RIFOXYD2_FULL_59_8]